MTGMKIRVRIATMLLRSAGLPVEYRVKRVRPRPATKQIADDEPTIVVENAHKDGTTVKRTTKLREACRRLRDMRCGDNDQLSVQLVSTVATRRRHGN